MATLKPGCPLVRHITSNGTRSVLEALFDRNGPFPVQESVLKYLTNEDYNAMRATKRSINEELTIRAPNLPPGATPRWRNQRYMNVKCHENGCAGSADTTTFIKKCEECDCPKGWRYRLVCAGCRHTNHWSVAAHIPGAISDHAEWMVEIAAAKARVCAQCNRDQHLRHPQGFDGCTCYRDQYSSAWTCMDCDLDRRWLFNMESAQRAHVIRRGLRCGNFGPHFVYRGPRYTRPWCLCMGRNVPRSRPKPRDAQQCIMCYGLTVPGLRRSERVRRARNGNTSVPSFQMLAAQGRGTIATRRVNQHGFNK